jgi:hypothetical protein
LTWNFDGVEEGIRDFWFGVQSRVQRVQGFYSREVPSFEGTSF